MQQTRRTSHHFIRAIIMTFSVVPHSPDLTLKLLNAVVPPSRDQSQRHNARDMHLRAEDMHAETKLLAHSFNVLEAFLVVGAGAADPDFDFVFVEEGCDFAEGADDAFEC